MATEARSETLASALLSLLADLPYRWEEGHRTTLTVPEPLWARAELISDALGLRSVNKALLIILQLGAQRMEVGVAQQVRIDDRVAAWRDYEAHGVSDEELDDAEVDKLWEQALSWGEPDPVR